MSAPIDHPNANDPLYWRFNGLANLVGIAPETLLREIDAGRVKVRVETFGPRGDRYAHRGDALAYIESIRHGAAA